MSDGLIAWGTTLTRDGHLVAELNKIGGLEGKVNKVDMTHHQSPYGIKQPKPGLREISDVSIEGNFIPSDTDGQIAMWADYKSGAVREWVISSKEEEYSWTFKGFVSAYSTDQPVDGKVPFKASITPTIEEDDDVPVLGIGESNDLSGLTASAGVLLPAFSATVYDYVLTEAAGATGVTLTPTASLGVIEVDGNVVTSGQASSNIVLGAAGSLKDVEVRVTETDKVRKTYRVKIAKALT
jgi:hypothetical protein